MHRQAYLCLVVATLCWGGNAVAGKLALGHISPMMLTFCRWLFATIIIFAISMKELRRDWPVIRRSIPVLGFLGVIGYVVFNAVLYTAVTYTSAINATVEQTLIPVLIFFINFVLFRTRVTLLQIAGFSLTVIGVLLTASHGDLNTLLTLTVNFGDAIMIIAIAAYAFYTIALRWRPAIHWKSLMAVPALFALIFSIPLLGWEYAAGKTIWPDHSGWLLALYTAIFASLIAQVLYIRGVETIGANRAGLFINLVPVFGTLLSIVVLGEELHLFHIAALLLALGGIAIAERGKPNSA
ncbi:DMT family transporter [Neorhizobium sp. NCHU2750]|uniref:DMT family transporter n=1 Tax=Neorhizobium sp. NCHU2750 TaxID=1825976 RepID=UPI000E70EFA9|nr:membrane protein [Neorhizobium sp. NCHU2750]